MNKFHSFNKFKISIFSGLFLGLCLFSYGQSAVETTKTDTPSKTQTVKVSPQKFRIGAQAGYGYRIARIQNSSDDPVMQDHLEKLKHNLSFGADLSYYFTNFIGVGIKYNAIVSHVVTNDITYHFADGDKKYNYLSELVDIHYFAPLFTTQFFTLPHKQCLFANAGAGYVLYRRNAMLFKQGKVPETQEIANTFKHSAAFFAEIGYDFFVSKHFAIGLQTSLLVEFKKGKWVEPENLSHIDISLGFRFYK